MLIKLVYQASLIAAILTNSVLMFLLIRRVSRTLVTTSFTMFLLFINIWAIPTLLISIGLPANIYPVIDEIGSFGFIMLPVAFVVFSFSFSYRSKILQSYVMWLLLYVPTLIFLFIDWTSGLISVHDYSKMQNLAWGYQSPVGFVFPIFLAWFELLMAISLIVLVIHYIKTTETTKRRQIKSLIFALFIPLIIGSVTDGILPSLNITIFPAAIPLTTITALIIAYAIFKHGLFEASSLTILANIADGVITTDKTGEVFMINDTAKKILGLTDKEVVGKLYYDLVKLKDDKNKTVPLKQRPLYMALQQKKKIVDDRYSFVKGRKKIPVFFTITPMFLKNKLIGATITFRDISHEKEVSTAKTEFVSFASHQLTNPLSIIKLYTDMMIRGRAGEIANSRQRLFLQEISYASNRMMELITDFLNLSRIESGEFAQSPKQVNIKEVVQNVLHEFKLRIQEKKLRIIQQYRTGKTLFTDQIALQIILQNLISNAIKYTPDKGIVTIDVSSYRSMTLNREYMTIQVSDTGYGIPKIQKTKIFSKLFRARNVSQKGIQGTGLGLYLVKSIVSKLGGKISFDSEENKGTTFTVKIPC